MDHLKYPIGTYQKPTAFSKPVLESSIQDIESFPRRLKDAVATLSDAQLDTPYREGGWTLRQVVHHCADSHMNSLIRFKLALTENVPTIKPYFEDRWAELADTKAFPIASSLLLLEGLHARWAHLLRSLSETDLQREFLHPEHVRTLRLDETIGLYAWHCNHHLAHITGLKSRRGWK